MKKLFDLLRISNGGRSLIYNFVPRRGARYQESLKWVKPERKELYDPVVTGDLAAYPAQKLDSIYFYYKGSKELENANEKVKKVFSLGYQLPKYQLQHYVNELVEKVKSHSLDVRSDEVRIARLTAQIRYYQHNAPFRGRRKGRLNKKFHEIIDCRKKMLKLLRLKDYRKFEWLLQVLDLEYRSHVAPEGKKLERDKSLRLLAKLKVEQVKEKRLAEYKRTLDKQKIPFLEKKITKLKEIKALEEQYGLSMTVTEEDIQGCVEKLEKVKIENSEKAKKGYKRKIHPYFLEPYDEDLLREKEKAAELIREKQESQSTRTETNTL